MQIRRLEDLELNGKKVFLRLDLNVPVKSGQIQDDTRIREALPTIRYILERTHRLTIASHLGRPKNGGSPADSLEPVGVKLSELLDKEVVLFPDYTTESTVQLLNSLGRNQLMLLENLRFHSGEEANNVDFAHSLVDGFDFYVNDAFGTCHRAHSSVSAAAELFSADQRGAGLLIQKELTALGGILAKPEAPFTVIMGEVRLVTKFR